MSILKHFRKRRPVVHADEELRAEFDAFISDAKVAFAWDLTLDQWRALTDFERKTCRRTVTTAPNFQP